MRTENHQTYKMVEDRWNEKKMKTIEGKKDFHLPCDNHDIYNDDRKLKKTKQTKQETKMLMQNVGSVMKWQTSRKRENKTYVSQ